MHLKEIEYVQNQNALLRKTLEDKNEYLNGTLAMKDSELENALERIKLMEGNTNKENEIRCVICDQLFDTNSGLRGHTNKKHGDSSQKEHPIQMVKIDMVRKENNKLKESLGNAEEINKELPYHLNISTETIFLSI